MRITVSEVCTWGRSIPGTSGSTGREPEATTICAAVISSPDAVRRTRGPVKRTRSW